MNVPREGPGDAQKNSRAAGRVFDSSGKVMVDNVNGRPGSWSIGDSSAVLRHVRALFGAGAAGGMSDGQLLERFRKQGGGPDAEAAFAVLVARHGPMVFGVCRRALRDPNDAADAFQATFLVLVRKAGSVRGDDSLGRWLYGVSRRVAAKARAARTRRAAREGGDLRLEPAGPESADEAERLELLAAIDEEVCPASRAVPRSGRAVRPRRLDPGSRGPAVRLPRRDRREPPLAGPQAAARAARPARPGTHGRGPGGAHASGGPRGVVRIHRQGRDARCVASSAAVSTLIEGVITDMAWTTIKTLALGLGAVTVACGLGITAAHRLQTEGSPQSKTGPAAAPETPGGRTGWDGRSSRSLARSCPIARRVWTNRTGRRYRVMSSAMTSGSTGSKKRRGRGCIWCKRISADGAGSRSARSCRTTGQSTTSPA